MTDLGDIKECRFSTTLTHNWFGLGIWISRGVSQSHEERQFVLRGEINKAKKAQESRHSVKLTRP